MGNGWHEWPLMVFTVFGQCVVGGFIVLALALMTGKLSREQEQRVVGSMFGLWVLMGIGFIASTMHLGSPLRAFNSLNRVGASSLSNEIASGAIFFAVGGIGWLLAVCKKAACRPAEPVAGGDHGAGRDFRVDDGAGVQHHRHGADLVHRLDAAELLPDAVYRRSTAGLPAAARRGRRWLGAAPAAGG